MTNGKQVEWPTNIIINITITNLFISDSRINGGK